jgi:hypothetical protein
LASTATTTSYFFDPRHEFLLQFLFPKLAAVELSFYGLVAFQIGKSAHPETCIVIFAAADQGRSDRQSEKVKIS